MALFLSILALTAPLFLLVFIGYALGAWGKWPKSVSGALTRFVFALALPAMLFYIMSDFSRMPPTDARLLIAFFGACVIVFFIGRLVSRHVFRLDGVSQSVFSLGGIFSNIVLLGLPVAKVTLGDESIPPVSLVLVFNAFILWTLVTVSVEWAKHGEVSWVGIARTAKGVFGNPVVIGILGGTAFGYTGLTIPATLGKTLSMVGQSAVPLSLLALGMGLAEHGVRDGWRQSLAMCALKLALMPLMAWLLARALGLGAMETRVVTVLASMSVGANVYLMANQFKVMGGPVASSLVLSTLAASLSTPLVLALTAP